MISDTLLKEKLKQKGFVSFKKVNFKWNHTLKHIQLPHTVRAMDCGIDGSYMEEGVAEIYILDTDELFSSYTKRLCMKVRNADSVSITMWGTEGSTTHVEVNKNKSYKWILNARISIYRLWIKLLIIRKTCPYN